MKNIIIILIVLVGISIAGTRVYDLEPYRNVNAWSPYYGWVGQTFVAICDSFVFADVFIGDSCRSANNGHFNIEILNDSLTTILAQGITAAGCSAYFSYAHAKFTYINSQVKIVKGKTYFLKITHSNGDSINFYYDSTNSYEYGQISSGGGILYPPPQNASRCDLAARIEGINKDSC